MEFHPHLLLVIVCLLLAGCTTGGPSDAPTTATPTPPTPTTVSSCPPFADLAPKPLPEKPANLTKETAVRFAVAYEEAIVWNRQIKDEKISLSVGIFNASVITPTETGYILHLEGGFGFEDCLDGHHVAGDGLIRTNYFINDTTVIRLETPTTPTTDPRHNGTIVERWSSDSAS